MARSTAAQVKEARDACAVIEGQVSVLKTLAEVSALDADATKNALEQIDRQTRRIRQSLGLEWK